MVTVITIAGVTVRKRKRRSYRPGPAARDLQKFLDTHNIPVRRAAAGMKVTHGAVISWLSGLSKPGAAYRKRIEIWTGGAVPELAWLQEDRELADIKPFSTQQASDS